MDIERLSEDRLKRRFWQFSFYTPNFGRGNNVTARLDFYAEQERATTRHKFKTVQRNRWERSNQRGYWSGLEAKDVPMPDDVLEEVRRSLTVTIQSAEQEGRYY